MDRRIFLSISTLCAVFLASSIYIHCTEAAALPSFEDSKQLTELLDDAYNLGVTDPAFDRELRFLDYERWIYRHFPGFLVKWYIRRKEEKLKRDAAKKARNFTKKLGF
ncbi:hypothetical protein LSTR_LSTR015448 [Laodelphax striatellus]|uniref:Uncharacterized protein n=1 Tax=Laodelphax striatellus TaxID=195883 RepID=A0A482WF83_LAOST|nr:hypothetical protein LSTR_LSTR015448 [Laodelphax striatellus]